MLPGRGRIRLGGGGVRDPLAGGRTAAFLYLERHCREPSALLQLCRKRTTYPEYVASTLLSPKSRGSIQEDRGACLRLLRVASLVGREENERCFSE